MNKKGLIITLVISLLVVPLYIYAFNNDLTLFWIIFVLDRVISPLVQARFEKAFDNLILEPEDNGKTATMSKFLISIILLVLIGMGMLIYVLFESPMLFIILILGEVMDNIAGKMVIE